MRLSQTEAQLIRGGFNAIRADAKASAEIFYRHLFQKSPALRQLFVADMERQGAKLIQTLETVAELLDKWGLLRTAVEDLGIRHAAYGVRAEHYPLVGDALQAMLVERLGATHSPEVAAAWAKAYDAIAAAMIRAAYPDDLGSAGF